MGGRKVLFWTSLGRCKLGWFLIALEGASWGAMWTTGWSERIEWMGQ